MKACRRACATHYRAIHGMARHPTVRRYVCEAKHGKSKVIGCMEHSENTWKQVNLMLTGQQQHYEATLEQGNNQLQQAINATRGMDGYSMTFRTEHVYRTSPDYAQNDQQQHVYVASRNNRFSLAKHQHHVPYLTSSIHSPQVIA